MSGRKPALFPSPWKNASVDSWGRLWLRRRKRREPPTRSGIPVTRARSRRRPACRNYNRVSGGVMRFDELSRTFEISVRELAEEEGFRRLGLGTEIHSRVFAARRETFGNYRCEVHLKARIPVDEWTAVLTGRLDGCLE